MAFPKNVHLRELTNEDFFIEYKDCYQFYISLFRPTLHNHVMGSVKVYVMKETLEIGKIETTVGRGKSTKTVLLKDSSMSHFEDKIINFFKENKLSLLFIIENGPVRNKELTEMVSIFPVMKEYKTSDELFEEASQGILDEVTEEETKSEVVEENTPVAQKKKSLRLVLEFDENQHKDLVEFIKASEHHKDVVKDIAKYAIRDYVQEQIEYAKIRKIQFNCYHDYKEVERDSRDDDGYPYFDDDGVYDTVELVTSECRKCGHQTSKMEYSDARY